MDFLSGLRLPWRLSMGESTRFLGGSAEQVIGQERYNKSSLEKKDEMNFLLEHLQHRNIYTLKMTILKCKVKCWSCKLKKMENESETKKFTEPKK